MYQDKLLKCGYPVKKLQDLSLGTSEVDVWKHYTAASRKLTGKMNGVELLLGTYNLLVLSHGFYRLSVTCMEISWCIVSFRKGSKAWEYEILYFAVKT